MTRNTFLASIAALFSAPFIGKSKKIAIPEADARWLNANPAHKAYVDGQLAIYIDGKKIAVTKPVTFSAEELEYVPKVTINASDIRRIHEQGRYRRGRI